MWTETERSIMGDVYRLIASHYETKSSEEYWIDLTRQAGEIMMRYDCHPLAKHMAMSVVEYLEQDWKNKDESLRGGVEECKQLGFLHVCS